MPDRDVEIIDTHCHTEAWFMDEPLKRPDPTWFRELYAECRHRTRLVISSTGGGPVMRQGNVVCVRTLAGLLAPFPDKFIGSMMINPHGDDALEAIELGAGELGMRCVGELVQYIHNWRTDGPLILPVVQKAIDLELTMMFHVSDETHAEAIARLAEKFPRGRFIAAHASGGRSWRRGIETVRRLPNVWVEIMRGNEDQLKLLLEAVGAARITYGTDFAIDARPELRYRAGSWLLDCLERLKLKDADVQRITSGNAKELLNL
ncbi:MAG TPA: amidohydrolase family protein [Planctomycetota bacterium]|nr:amidohydrolase family protein [Planctomycetota bacterium]